MEEAILNLFKGKIEDAIAMVQAMAAEEKLKAVHYWNVVSERLQDIVNNSVEDISALAFQMEGEKSGLPDYIDASQLVNLGMAPSFVARYISNTDESETALNDTRKKTSIDGDVLDTANVPGRLELLPNNNNIQQMVVVAAAAKNDREQQANEEVVMNIEEIFDMTNERVLQETAGDQLTVHQYSPAHHISEAFITEILHDTINNTAFSLQASDEEEAAGSNTVHMMITKDSQPPTATKAVPFRPNVLRRGRRAKRKDGIENTEEHYVNGPVLECEYCHRIFNTSYQLTIHRRRHSGEKPFSCPHCKAAFSTNGNLKRHLKLHSGEKPWQCAQCGSRFTEKKSLKVHMRRHTGERPFQCSMCVKSFTQTSILQAHMAMHLNQKEHLCNQCGKSFRQKSQLRLHEQRHAGLRKYECPVCPYKFLTKGDMQRHRRTHTGERPYVCKECGKTFTRRQSLNEHMNRHKGLKPYRCKYCKRGFVEMSACYKHIKVHEQAKSNEKPSKATAEKASKQSSADSGLSELEVHQKSGNAQAQPEIPIANGAENTDRSTIVVHKLTKTTPTSPIVNGKPLHQLQIICL